MLTGHKHWQKTKDRVKPLSEPLTEWLNTLPAEIVEKVQKCILPVSMAYGASILVIPDLMVEMEFRKLKARALAGGGLPTVGTTPATSVTPPPAPTDASNPSAIAPEADL